MRTVAIAAAIILGIIAASSDGVTATNTVSVVYFYPRDQEPNLEYVAQVDVAVEEMSAWYGAQVGSTFSADPVQVMRGVKTLVQYQTDHWGLILRELGYYCGTGVHLVILHESIAPRYGGGGSCSGDGDGSALVAESWLGSGVVPHELGHAFALPHPQGCGTATEPAYCAETVMWSWWFYPNVGLLDYEIQALQATSYFEDWNPEPTPTLEPAPEPTPKPCKPFRGKGKALGRCRA